MQKTQQWISLG